MDQPARQNWIQRNPAGSAPPTQAAISRLSRDFVDVEKRAKRIATRKGVQWSAAIASIVTLLGILLQLTGSGRFFSNPEIEDLKKRQEAVEYDIKNRVDIDRKLQDFDNRLKDLERTKEVQKTKGTKTTS